MWFPARIITPWSSSEFFSYARRNVYVLNSIYNKVPRFHQLERLQALFLYKCQPLSSCDGLFLGLHHTGLCQGHREGDPTHNMKCEIQLGQKRSDLKPYPITKDNLQLQYKVCCLSWEILLLLCWRVTPSSLSTKSLNMNIRFLRCCQWLKSCTSLLLIMGSSIPRGWRLQKARFSSVMKRRDIFRRNEDINHHVSVEEEFLLDGKIDIVWHNDLGS